MTKCKYTWTKEVADTVNYYQCNKKAVNEGYCQEHKLCTSCNKYSRNYLVNSDLCLSCQIELQKWENQGLKEQVGTGRERTLN